MASTALVYLLIILHTIIHSVSQPSSPQNIETFYPTSPLPFIPPPTPPQPPPSTRSSTSAAVGRAIGITAASTIVLSGILFFLLHRYNRRKRDQRVVNSTPTNGGNNSNNPPVTPPQVENFTRIEGNVKGLIVDENGLDVLYWRELEDGDNKSSFKKEYYKKKSLKDEEQQKEEEKRIVVSERSKKHNKQPVLVVQEAPLLRGKSSTSESPYWAEKDIIKKESLSVSFKVEEDQDSELKLMKVPTRTEASSLVSSMEVEKGKTPQVPADLKGKMAALPPVPPSPSGGATATSLLVPQLPKGVPNKRSYSVGVGTSSKKNEQVKLKLPMTLEKIDKDSSKFEGDLMMEALFGYVATNRKSPKTDGSSPSPRWDKQGPPSQILILNETKSQNAAVVLRSLGVSRKEIIDALIEGQGLNAETIVKLNNIAPTDEESSQIVAFDGDPMRLADAESFLYHLLKAVPSAFSRFNAMLFRTNYDSEVSNFKESLRSIESGCNELRTQGLFLRLLEAVLKAGNQLNTGASNAQAFNLTALRKLSNVKSSDGKTTLLQFVVQEVVRAEGKRCVRNKDQTLVRTSSRIGNSGSRMESLSEDDQEREYMVLGLPVVGGLSAQFWNVKKAASLDYDPFTKATSTLSEQVMEIQKIVSRCATDEGFARKMKGFLDTAELEIRVLKEEEARVMELVRETAEHHQVGSLNDKGTNPFQLFVIVRDFLGMVDQVCIDIARNVQNKKPGSFVDGSSSLSGSPRVFRFPKLPANFMSDISNSSSGGSDNGAGLR